MRKISRASLWSACLTLAVVGVAHAGDEDPNATAIKKEPAPVSSNAPPSTAPDAPPASTDKAPPPKPTGPGGPDANSSPPSDRPTALPATEARLHARAAYAKALSALRDAELAARAAAAATADGAAALAGEKNEQAKQALQKAKTSAHSALSQAREELRAAGAAARDFQWTPEVRAVVDKTLNKLDDAHRADRSARAEKRRGELRKAHGALLDKPEVRAELARHVWRVARLQRLIEVAEAGNRTDALERARQLLTHEEARHSQALVASSGAPAANAKKGAAP